MRACCRWKKEDFAEVAGLRDADIIVEAAGIPVKRTEDIVETVKRSRRRGHGCR